MKISGRKIFWGSLGLCAALAPAYLYAHYEGPQVRHTAAPGDVRELACSTSGSATRGLQNGRTSQSERRRQGDGNFFERSHLYPGRGTRSRSHVTATDPVNTHYGFQMTARLASNPASGQAGSFNPGPNPGRTRIQLSSSAMTIILARPKAALRRIPSNSLSISSTPIRWSIQLRTPIRSPGLRQPRMSVTCTFYVAGNVGQSQWRERCWRSRVQRTSTL